jgi:predicted MFS family arabinose efflux permease
MTSERLRRNPAFISYLSAQTISFVGTGITTVVLPVLVYRVTGSPAAVASLNATEIVPYVVFGLLAGALADRLSRKKMMVACDGAAALLLAAVPAAAALHLMAPALLFVVAFGIGTAFVWFDAAQWGSLPTLIERAQLPAATSLIASSNSIPLIAGPALGGVLLTVIAPQYALGFDAASYLISALLITSIRRPMGPRPEHDHEEHRCIRSDIMEGLLFLWRQPVIRTMTLSVFCACVSWGGIFGLLVVYADRALHMTHANARLGLLYGVGELGSLISIAAVPKLVKWRAIGRLMTAFLTANIAAIALLAVAPSYGWALPLFCFYQIVFVLVTMTGITVRRMLTPNHLQARVNTAGRLVAYGGGQPMGAVLGGVLAQLLPIRLTFGLLAVGAAAGAGLAARACLGSGPLSEVSISAPSSEPAAAQHAA